MMDWIERSRAESRASDAQLEADTENKSKRPLRPSGELLAHSARSVVRSTTRALSGASRRIFGKRSVR